MIVLLLIMVAWFNGILGSFNRVAICIAGALIVYILPDILKNHSDGWWIDGFWIAAGAAFAVAWIWSLKLDGAYLIEAKIADLPALEQSPVRNSSNSVLLEDDEKMVKRNIRKIVL